MHLVILFEFLVNIYGQNVQNQTTNQKQTAQNKPKSIMKPKPEDPQERASNGIFQILNEGNGLTAMPRPASGKPLKVFLSVMIESITDISEVNMDMTLTICIHQAWHDHRLHSTTDFLPMEDAYSIPASLQPKIWVPDLHILGAKKSVIHSTISQNSALRLRRRGFLDLSLKMTTTVACQMSLFNFPLDTNNCSITIQSFGYGSKDLQLLWIKGQRDEELFMDKTMVESMPKFRLRHYSYHEKNWTYGGKLYNVTVSQLAVSFELERYLLSVFFQSYFPGMIMVILGGLSMFLDAKSVPARVSMGVMTVLTTSTIIQGLKNSLPQVSYLTALDIYLWACFLFVFAAVLEYVALNIMVRQRANASFKGTMKSSSSYSIEDLKADPEADYSNQKLNNGQTDAQLLTNGIDSKYTNGTQRGIVRRTINEDSQYVQIKPRMNGTNARSSKKSVFSVGKFRRKKFPQIKMSDWVRSPSNLEKKFRLIYFISFVAFNIAYWTYFTLSTRHKSDGESE